MNIEVMESSEGNVWKYIFTTDKTIAEAVLYKYNSFEERTVICCSVQSGCPVGCTFCGTGKNFIKNFTSEEIVNQVKHIISDKGIDTSKVEKFQIMFMSMGEPMLNFLNVSNAIRELNKLYPNAQLLLSTIGVDDNITFYKELIPLSIEIDKIGLQFSIHKSTDEERNELIPFKKKWNLRDIRDRGTEWFFATKRKVFLNYCINENNSSTKDIENLMNLFSPFVFNFTFSVICESDKDSMKCASERNDTVLEYFMQEFAKSGYNVRKFDPAGQDDIGGGCGQLWFVQDWLKNH